MSKAIARVFTRLLIPTVLAAVALAQLGRHAGFHPELTFHPDEPAHFITAAMIRDYAVSAPGSDPVAFAESYYVHYPKVAFGHWPPAFHLALAAWFLLLGVSVTAAVIFVCLSAAGTATVLTRRALPAYGPWSALLAGLTFLGLSIVRSEMGLVMAEMPLTLLCLLAVLAFADFTASRRLGDALRFSGWASLAVLTKGNALALALLPPLAILLTGAFGLLRSPKLWLAALIIAVVCGPVYYLTLHMAIAVGSDKGYVSSGYLLRNLQTVLPQFLLVACPALLAAAAVGSVRCLAEPVGTGEGPRHARTLRVVLAWVVAVLIFHVVVPISGEPRYLLPALPGVVLLAWHGLDGLGRVFTGRAARLGWAIPMLGGGLILGGDARPLRPLVAGYRAAAASIPVTDEGTVVLVASNTHGEGAFIVERRLQDPSRIGYVLRASKVLASDSWTGACYRPRFETTAELRRYLSEVPVHYLLFDDFPCPEQRNTAHLDLLSRLLRESPDEFPLVGVFPVRGWWGMREGTALLYLNRQAQGRAPGAIHIDMRRMLNREIGTEANPPADTAGPDPARRPAGGDGRAG